MSQKEAEEQVSSEQYPQELIQLATNISMQLGIPMLDNPIDLHFVTQCMNAILGGLNPKWKSVIFDPQNQQQLEQAWRKLFHIVQSAMLAEGQTILQEKQQIGIQNFMDLFEVLSQGCEALRQENLQPVSKQEKISKKQTKTNKKQDKKKSKSKSRSKEGHKKSQQKPKNSKPKGKTRPKTATNHKQVKNIYEKKLEQEIIQNVTKTMLKNYQTKAEPRRVAKIRQKQGTWAMQKAKRNLDYAIKDFEVSNRLLKNKQKGKSNIKKDMADEAYLKMISNKHKRLNEQIESQQLKYYLQLRDKKVAYIRHIHQLIEKLERQRQVESHKQQRQLQILKKKQMIEKIQSVNILFQQNMQKLKQNYENRRKVEELQNVGEIEVCRAMEKNIKKKKLREVEDIKNLWNQERNQLFRITNDEEKMKNKLIQIYRKYRV